MLEKLEHTLSTCTDSASATKRGKDDVSVRKCLALSLQYPYVYTIKAC